jgi:hypothetical protein
MYRGKRKRIRKKDLTRILTYEWPRAVNIVEFIVADKDNVRRMIDTDNIDGHAGDTMQFTVYLTLVADNGEKLLDHAPFVLLPAGPAYYAVDEDSP